MNLHGCISKNPELKRRELRDIAEQLFLEKGYQETRVKDIVKKAGVAQGTFYYYFQSKEAILDEITNKYINIIIESMEKISKQDNLNALEKLVKIFQFSLSFQNDTRGIMQYIHDEKNLHLHHKFEQRIPVETLGPIYLNRVLQKEFSIPNTLKRPPKHLMESRPWFYRE
ncbi:MAG: TetR/AcrR family transcriptional regulator [Methanobacterium sp.]|nr:TetR/AcrR family transcriptional regulator [Euryarchaeota archaeon]MBV1729267.1 TetR/AcrR family transcriptional regulator [Methanobacterium sp.]